MSILSRFLNTRNGPHASFSTLCSRTASGLIRAFRRALSDVAVYVRERYSVLRNLCKSGSPRPIAALHAVLRYSFIRHKLRSSNAVRLALGHARSLLQRFLKCYASAALASNHYPASTAKSRSGRTLRILLKAFFSSWRTRSAEIA